MSTREAVVAAVAEDPTLTAPAIAERFGISRQRVHQIVRTANLKLRRAPSGPRRLVQQGPGQRWMNGAGGIGKHNASFIGAALELIASVDLMKRGAHVYRAMSSTSPCDLVAWLGGELIRVEVRSGRRNGTGKLCYSPPEARRYDVLAVVEPNGTVTYKPDLPVT